MNQDFADVKDFKCQCHNDDLLFSDAKIYKDKIIYFFVCPKCSENTVVLEEVISEEPLNMAYFVMDKGNKVCKLCKTFLFEHRNKPRRRICFECGYDNNHPNIKPEKDLAKKTTTVTKSTYTRPVYVPDPLFTTTFKLTKIPEGLYV
jgi:hypothetical protein